MNFQHPEVQQHYERIMSLKAGGLSEMEQPIFALMDAYGWFRVVEDDNSPKVREIIEHLLSPELRPALRSWYRRFRDQPTNSVFIHLREQLSQAAGERFD